MDFSMLLAIFLGLYCLRLLRVNDRLRRRVDPWAKPERHYAKHPRVLP